MEGLVLIGFIFVMIGIAVIVEKLFKLLNLLEENEDVQSVSSNFEVTDQIMSQLTL